MPVFRPQRNITFVGAAFFQLFRYPLQTQKVERLLLRASGHAFHEPVHDHVGIVRQAQRRQKGGPFPSFDDGKSLILHVDERGEFIFDVNKFIDEHPRRFFRFDVFRAGVALHVSGLRVFHHDDIRPYP
ncbi:hypothetical protein SDC9_106035 [bioreactor metagenome]|uniref:Uncharacterized protein n=1 Tax=bioreactor metagenome TaxID=1076179 RepID=A0A645B155_9ZZZZ